MHWLLGEVWDIKAYITGLEVSPMRRHSLLAELGINSRPSDDLELAVKGIWDGVDEFNIIGIKEVVYHQVSG